MTAAKTFRMSIGRLCVLTTATLLALSPIVLSAADDGPLFRRNLSRTPALHTEDAGIQVMWLYVPAQDPQGEPPDTTSGELEYYVGDCTNEDPSACELVDTHPEAKPQVTSWLDGEVEFVGDLMFSGHGRRDAFAGLSLDDGATWKTYNLSRSGDLSSFTLRNKNDYPGDVIGISTAVQGNRIVVAWMSRYCEDGRPLYSWLDEEKTGLLTAYPELDHPINVDGGTDPDGFYQLYMDDLFSVAGSQGSSDFADEGYPEIGEVPYACLWTARGTLEQALDDSGTPMQNTNGDPIYDITWRAAERITAGKRDVNLMQVTNSPGAGFVLLWQEDPDGLRPGKGLCVDGGFNGANAHNGTDIWYTYLDLAHFGDVCLDTTEDVYCTPGTLADFTTSVLFGTKPKSAVPFAMPVRMTDNSACMAVQKFGTNGELIDAYCYADFDDSGAADLCASTVSWTNPGGTTLEVCVTEDGRTLTGQTASTRARAAMKSYDSDGDGAPDSAWVLFGSEKRKGLGSVGDDGCDPNSDPECTVFDIGKNAWYYTFEFDEPALGTQGLMLNAPALSPETGEPFEIYVDEWGNDIYDTEIARHFNLMVNSPSAAMASTSKIMGILIYKQGIINQGGPADIFTRRLVLPDDFDPAADNPFAYENVECVSYEDAGGATPIDRLYPDGVNPNYVLGLCPVDGMNVSATTLVRCSDGSSGEACADQFPFNSTYEEWFVEDSQTQIPRVLEWSQTVDNLNDRSWENPYDVSSYPQGFLDGDLVVLLYSTAPNWKASTVGREAHNLYARRSFDGGQTWTTLPADYTHWSPLNPNVTITADGTKSCETYGGYTEDDYQVCTDYPAGEVEPARNLSLLMGTKVTVLDARLGPTGSTLKKDYTSLLCYDEAAVPTEIGEPGTGWVNCGLTEATYPEDVRDPSAFFVSYQSGDNRVVDDDTGPAPLDMFYSRASNYGDDYDMQDLCAIDPEESWYPSAGPSCEEGETEFRFDWLEYGKRSKSDDAEITATPDGSRLYAVWSQEDFDKRGDLVGSDAWWRRVFYDLYTEQIPQ
jgi:hypothetical protein